MAATNGGLSTDSPEARFQAELAGPLDATAHANTGTATRLARVSQERHSIWAGIMRAARALAQRACRLAVSLARARPQRRGTSALMAGGAHRFDACAGDKATHDPAGPSAPTGLESRLLPEVARVEVRSDFGEQLYSTVFELLQREPRCKVLDLRAARMLRIDLFERLAAAWRVSADTIPKLAIVLGYESWAVLHKVARRRLQPLIDRGIAVELFYAQQVERLSIWFAQDRIDHDIAAIVAWLRTEWHGTATASPPPAASSKVKADEVVAVWPEVLRATAKLVKQYAPVDDVPELLLVLAELAHSFGDPDGTAEEIKHLHAALHWIGDAPSVAKCRALRALARPYFRRGDAAQAVQLLESAATIATVIGDRIERASALAEIGGHALRMGHFARAERRLRRAVALIVDHDPPHLRATLHHALARALHEQGQDGDEAAHHARAALTLRRDPGSQLAIADQALLAAIAARRRPACQAYQPMTSSDTGQQAHHDKPV